MLSTHLVTIFCKNLHQRKKKNYKKQIISAKKEEKNIKKPVQIGRHNDEMSIMTWLMSHEFNKHRIVLRSALISLARSQIALMALVDDLLQLL